MRYNTDQVPLPFVVDHDSTYTTEEDTDIHIAGSGKGDLRKRQFTMHIYVNAGMGDMRDGYIELICKGKVLLGGRYSPAERAAWDERVNMYFQKNAWMDRDVMAQSANTFNDHIKERWGETAKVLLSADNLDAHVFHGTKDTLAKDGLVVALFFPPDCTEAVQPIDAGYGRSIRCSIGRQLDAWLMESDHLEVWEKGMTAAERRVLVSKFVAEANEEILHKDESRISCFSRCGMLLTLDGTGDEMIKPQGCTKLPLAIPEYIDVTMDEDFASPNKVILPEALEFGLSVDENATIHVGDKEDDIGVDALVVQEEDDVEDDKIEGVEELNPIDENLESDVSDDENSAEDIETRDLDENMLIKEAKRGRRTVRRTRCYCHEYW